MRLTKLYFENFKAFPHAETLEVRPLTVLIGRNSSGKSAIARLPLLLSYALDADAESPLPLPSIERDGIDLGESFVDLIHNRISNGWIRLGAEFTDEDGRRLELRARIQNIREYELQVVSEFSARFAGVPWVELRWIERDPLNQPAEYKCAIEGRPPIVSTVPFQGLLPALGDWTGYGDGASLQERKIPVVWQVRRALIQQTMQNIGYLGPFRTPPERHYRYPGGSLRHVGINGEDTPAVLGADALRYNKSVLTRVSQWYERHLGGWSLDVSRQGSRFSLILRDPSSPQSPEVNLVDAGVGLSQVLAIVVQRFFDTAGRENGGATDTERAQIEITEQPELHLHPAAHGSIADLYVDAVKQTRGTFIVETHSENFILRLRRRVADNTLSADQVRIYWIDPSPGHGSAIKPIDILDNGDVSDWPKGVFSEDFDELMAIRKLVKRDARPTGETP